MRGGSKVSFAKSNVSQVLVVYETFTFFRKWSQGALCI